MPGPMHPGPVRAPTATQTPPLWRSRPSDLVAKITGQREDPHPRIGALKPLQEVQGSVVAAVVDVDEFEFEFGNPFEGGDETTMCFPEDRLLVETGDDHGQKRAGVTSVGGGVGTCCSRRISSFQMLSKPPSMGKYWPVLISEIPYSGRSTVAKRFLSSRSPCCLRFAASVVK